MLWHPREGSQSAPLFGFSFPSRAAKADAAPDGADGQTFADPAALGTDATVES